LNKSDVKSLDIAVTRFLMKLFKSVNLDLINVHLDSCVMEATSYKLPASALGRDSNFFHDMKLMPPITAGEQRTRRLPSCGDISGN